MNTKVLLLDTIDEAGVDIIRSFATLVDGRGYSYATLIDEIEKYDALVIKSGNRIDRTLIERAVKLKVIGRAGAGFDNIDMDAAMECGVQVVLSPDGNVNSVAEYVLCMSILLSHKLEQAHAGSRSNDFRRHTWQGRNLDQLNVGLVGLGKIGMGVARKLGPMCRSLLGFDPYAKDLAGLRETGLELFSDLDTMLGKCDIVSLHVPLTAETKHMFNRDRFSAMKKGCILINTARGGVIEQNDLLRAFAEERIASAALDTLDPDPNYSASGMETTYSHFLVHHPKVFYTPHIAAGTSDALREVAVRMANDMRKHLVFARTPDQECFPAV